MERIIANVTGTIRRELRDGREYIVAPLTLIVPGVLNGSQGPLLYTLNELKATADAWNGMPIVVGHPMNNGATVSARDPAVLEKVGIGEVFNASADGKLRADGWFDVEKTEAVDSRIIDSLRAGKPIELSTGLFTENEDAPSGSEDNGTPYIGITRNHKPDHLAILPDSLGACSVSQGCGVLVNAAISEGFTGNVDGHMHIARVNEGGHGITSEANGHRHPVKSFRVGKETRGGHTHPLEKTALIDSGVRNQLPTHKEVTMTDAQKTSAVDALIANGECCWEEDDRATLLALTDKQLGRLTDNSEKVTDLALVANAATEGFADKTGDSHKFDAKAKTWVHTVNGEPVTTPKPLTREDVLTEEDKEDLAFARNEKQRQKDSVIARLVANVAETDRPAQAERLKTRSLADLQQDAALLPVTHSRQTDYSGAAGGPSLVTANIEGSLPNFGLPGEDGYLTDAE